MSGRETRAKAFLMRIASRKAWKKKIAYVHRLRCKSQQKPAVRQNYIIELYIIIRHVFAIGRQLRRDLMPSFIQWSHLWCGRNEKRTRQTKSFNKKRDIKRDELLAAGINGDISVVAAIFCANDMCYFHLNFGRPTDCWSVLENGRAMG